MYYAIDTTLVVATLFFLFLPITDRKTARMKLGMVAVTASLFVASVIHTQSFASSGQAPRAVQAPQAVAMNNR